MIQLLRQMLLTRNQLRELGLFNLNEAELRAKARSCFQPLAIRRKKADVSLDLPPKKIVNLYMKLRPEQEVLYKAASHELEAQVRAE